MYHIAKQQLKVMRKIDFNSSPSKHNPFVVPENYFAQFTLDMMQLIAKQPMTAYNPQWRVIKWIPWMGVACVVSLFLLFTQLLNTSYIDASRSAISQQHSKSADKQADEAYDYLMLADNIAFYEN